jgi:tRNA C32,U32 (ribose-2'-O)-methylase TrmJ
VITPSVRRGRLPPRRGTLLLADADASSPASSGARPGRRPKLALDRAGGGGVGGGDERVALPFGAEGLGLSPGTLAAVDVRAGIPMRGGVDSLNVGVAAGIAFWALGRAGRHRD